MSSPKVWLLVLMVGGLLSLCLGWWAIAFAADSFVLYVIRPEHQFYTSFQYLDFVWVYVGLSALCLAVFFNIRVYVKKWVFLSTVLLCFVFVSFLGIMICDDIQAARPIGPEIVFTFLILILHVSVFFGAIKAFKTLSRNQTSRLFR